jgi:hypothetical protein
MDNVDDGGMCNMILADIIERIKYDERIKQKKEMEAVIKRRKLNSDIRIEILQLIQNTILKYNATRIKEKENKSNAREELKEYILKTSIASQFRY